MSCSGTTRPAALAVGATRQARHGDEPASRRSQAARPLLVDLPAGRPNCRKSRQIIPQVRPLEAIADVPKQPVQGGPRDAQLPGDRRFGLAGHQAPTDLPQVVGQRLEHGGNVLDQLGGLLGGPRPVAGPLARLGVGEGFAELRAAALPVLDGTVERALSTQAARRNLAF